MKRFQKVRDLILGLEGDFEKFYDKENQAAGTRVRKGMQEMKTLAQDIRKEVQDMKNKRGGATPTKKAATSKAKPAASASKGKK